MFKQIGKIIWVRCRWLTVGFGSHREQIIAGEHLKARQRLIEQNQHSERGLPYCTFS
ncbi:hypothetical protein ACIOVC_03720 [Pseudomonas neuropathica]|jgi:hypothetical protein|uniref:hypothetical protein n=1 Tax=Pseudomonas sp. ok266 TaxID=1761896 RepID=UPI0008AF4A38|nr:hypothetical protein [Pseudomonas sp. ok266]SEO19097.1 hypothetical protein SAMN04487856_106316 [Pseudomonas sp. ok266]